MNSDDEEDPATLEKMSTIAERFPFLRGEPGVRPWDPRILDEWAASEEDLNARCAAQFVLSVWNQNIEWKCGGFDLHHAVSVFNPQHLLAFIAWIADPWWPEY